MDGRDRLTNMRLFGLQSNCPQSFFKRRHVRKCRQLAREQRQLLGGNALFPEWQGRQQRISTRGRRPARLNPNNIIFSPDQISARLVDRRGANPPTPLLARNIDHQIVKFAHGTLSFVAEFTSRDADRFFGGGDTVAHERPRRET